MQTHRYSTTLADEAARYLEAVDLSEKDGALVCLVQVRVRFGG